MDSRLNRQGEAGNCIWLRYATQIAGENGRSQTVEMEIPVPVGASAEQRERLLQEAEEGLAQLVRHIRQRIPQIIQQGQVASPRPGQTPEKPANRPASLPAPQTAPQPAQVREAPQVRETKREEKQQEEDINVPSSEEEENKAAISIPEFVKLINDTLHLNPRQAMTMLKVRSLSGINLREAYERLRYLTARDNPRDDPPAPSPSATRVLETRSENEPREQETKPGLPPGLRRASELPSPARPPVREREEEEEDDDEYYALPVGFAEEVDLDEEEVAEGGLTPRMREQAWDAIARLRDAQGSVAVSPARLQVLRNVLDGQLSSEQLQTLIGRLWNVNNPKKLKVDQAEALISWAKEDEFVNEAEAALQILEEEDYARGNR